jgi:hypothetical protein
MKNPLIFLLALLPFAAAAFYVQSASETLSDLQTKVATLHQKAARIEEQKKIDACLFSQIQKADPSYTDTYLATLQFLEDEARRIQALSSHQKENSALQHRLDFLRSGENRLVFVENKRERKKEFQEVEERLQHPVEMNEEDLKKVLVLIEGVTLNPYSPKEGRPQLMVTDFDLTKRRALSDEEVYVIDLKLLKREK